MSASQVMLGVAAAMWLGAAAWAWKFGKMSAHLEDHVRRLRELIDEDQSTAAPSGPRVVELKMGETMWRDEGDKFGVVLRMLTDPRLVHVTATFQFEDGTHTAVEHGEPIATGLEN